LDRWEETKRHDIDCDHSDIRNKYQVLIVVDETATAIRPVSMSRMISYWLSLTLNPPFLIPNYFGITTVCPNQIGIDVRSVNLCMDAV
ncbi:MAG: hypothetical protein ACLPN1_16660, partial [Dissulfurispiraceae bacterium]